jgi:hypothetical protein
MTDSHRGARFCAAVVPALHVNDAAGSGDTLPE